MLQDFRFIGYSRHEIKNLLKKRTEKPLSFIGYTENLEPSTGVIFLLPFTREQKKALHKVQNGILLLKGEQKKSTQTFLSFDANVRPEYLKVLK